MHTVIVPSGVAAGALPQRKSLARRSQPADDGTVSREQSCSREIRVGDARSDVARDSLAARRIEPSLPNRDGRSTLLRLCDEYSEYMIGNALERSEAIRSVAG